MISICMTTYNGEKFLEEQLESISAQTLKVDEVIICDDNSMDGTVTIIKNFIQRNELDKTWKLIQNKKNKGYPGNFYYAMSLCTGDIVFFADQDDVWKPNKIELMMEVMCNNLDVQLLASKWEMINEVSEEIKGHLKIQKMHKNRLNVITLENILYRYEWPGMSMCCRRKIVLDTLKVCGNTKLAHDLAIACIASEERGFYVLNEVLQYHRRHERNTAKEEHRIKFLLNYKRKIDEINDAILTYKLMDEIYEFTSKNKELISQKLKLLMQREQNLREKKIGMIIKGYLQNTERIRLETVVCDIILIVKCKFGFDSQRKEE